MKCDCCGRKKKLLEAFALVDSGENKLNLCVECNDLLYKLRDAANESDTNEFESIQRLLAERIEGNASKAFQTWIEIFIEKQRTEITQSKTEAQADQSTIKQPTTE